MVLPVMNLRVWLFLYQFIIIIVVVLLLKISSKDVYSAMEEASVNTTVIAAITIDKISDLEFGIAVQGDGPKQVIPGTTENAENASFLVSGEPYTGYHITLPHSVMMTTGQGMGVRQQIIVNNFASFPSGNGMLNGRGFQLLFVGATRSALLLNQTVGAYRGTFIVEVVYN